MDFGAFPGKSDASVAVTGQGAILAGSLVEAWIRPVATADHTDTEHMVETFQVFAASIIAGTGFTIYGFNTSQINEPITTFKNPSIQSIPSPSGINVQGPVDGFGGTGTRIYGQWTIAWVWN